MPAFSGFGGAPPVAPAKKPKPGLGDCSFCGKGKPEVYVIQGPAVGICNECVGLCVDMLREEKVPLGVPYLTVNYKRHGDQEPYVLPVKGRMLRFDFGDATWVWKHVGEGTATRLTWTPEMSGDEAQEFIREHVYNGLGSERGTVRAFWRQGGNGFHVGLIHFASEVQEEKVTGDKPEWAFDL